MPRVKEITVFVSRKISKNYNSTDHSCGVTVEVEEGENLEDVATDLRIWCKQRVREAFRADNQQNGEQSE